MLHTHAPAIHLEMYQILLENKCHGLLAVFALKWQRSSQHFELENSDEKHQSLLSAVHYDMNAQLQSIRASALTGGAFCLRSELCNRIYPEILGHEPELSLLELLLNLYIRKPKPSSKRRPENNVSHYTWSCAKYVRRLFSVESIRVFVHISSIKP